MPASSCGLLKSLFQLTGDVRYRVERSTGKAVICDKPRLIHLASLGDISPQDIVTVFPGGSEVIASEIQALQKAFRASPVSRQKLLQTVMGAPLSAWWKLSSILRGL